MLFFMYIMLDTYTIIHIHQWVIVELIYWWDQNPSITHWQQPYMETNLSSISVASWVFKTLCLMQGDAITLKIATFKVKWTSFLVQANPTMR